MHSLEQQIFEILVEAYGDENKAKDRFELHCQIKPKAYTLARLIKNHGISVAREKFLEKVKMDARKGTLEYYIEKYGETEGTLRYKEKNSKLSVGVDTLKRAGKSDEEISAIKQKHSSKSINNLDNFILRHGESGIEKYNDYDTKRKERSPRCIEYYLSKGIPEDIGYVLLADFQRRDWNFFDSLGWTEDEYSNYCIRRTSGFRIEYYIEKYGEEEGRRLYYFDHTKGSNLEFLQKVNGEELGRKIYNDILKKKVFSISKDSKIQIEFSQNLYDKLSVELQKKFYGAPITKGFWINYKENSFGIKCSIPDIRILNLLIEFDGTYWHKEGSKNFERDAMKMTLNDIQYGFTTIRVPEESYKNNPEKTIDFVLEQIHSKINYSFRLRGKYED